MTNQREGQKQNRHEGVRMTGADGADGPKAFYIEIDALPGKESEVLQMLRDILACVEEEGRRPDHGTLCATRRRSSQYSRPSRT